MITKAMNWCRKIQFITTPTRVRLLQIVILLLLAPMVQPIMRDTCLLDVVGLVVAKERQSDY